MTEQAAPPSTATKPAEPVVAATDPGRAFRNAIVLFVLTLVSTLYVGAGMNGVDVATPLDLTAGWDFSLPLLAILLSHEFGHYFTARIHRVDVSPPYFIPMPVPPLGTMGAVIHMRGRITSRAALLDIGASGPLAGLVVAMPVLVYGIWISPVTPLPEAGTFIIEGRSIFYSALIYALKGPIPEGSDIFLSPIAFAGWAGLLVTMMNLLPIGQLDGGHIAYALLGDRHHRIGRWFWFLLPAVTLATGLFYGIPATLRGADLTTQLGEWAAGLNWTVWFLVLGVMAIMSRGRFRITQPRRTWATLIAGLKHPPITSGQLGPGRKAIAWLCLVLFVLLFMPSWMRAG